MQQVREENMKKAAVWEEALLQEFIYAIGHINHVEQHLIEIDSSTGLPIFGDIIDMFREQRKLVGQIMFLIERIEATKSDSDIRSSWENIWCALKHATSALIHIDECIEKLLKKARESGNTVMLECVKTLLNIRSNILRNIINVIRRGKEASSALAEASVRCREDLCIEEVEKR
ncbi:MAG: hypothetical protein QW101_00020 [Ignisphaera sp.]|uniref:Uncharacterized protein n=1 Tax=Ignisphaera aggregans TaxID=334771 RepID=A0A7J3MX37_9CREN